MQTVHAHSSLSWSPLLSSAHTFNLKARKQACGFRSFQPSPLFSPTFREVAAYFPLPAFGTIFQFTVCRAAGISLLVQEARITFLPFIHSGVPTHFVVALFEALLGLDLYGPMDGFFAAAWEHLESHKGKEQHWGAYLSVNKWHLRQPQPPYTSKFWCYSLYTASLISWKNFKMGK